MTEHHLRIFNVQHGACAHLKIVDDGVRWDVLIDCGHMNNERGRWYPGDYLRSEGVYSLDLLIVTNLDEDHVSGLPNLLERVTVRHIFSNPTVAPYHIKTLKKQFGMGSGIEALVRELTNRDLASEMPYIPGLNAAWACNRYQSPFEDENNLSLVVSLNIPFGRFLFAGDMECDGFNHLLRSQNLAVVQQLRGVDFFLAPHHGRKNGICPALFDVHGCRPKLVIISDDYMQYDTQETCDYYRGKATGFTFKDETRFVLTTRSDGTIDFLPLSNSMYVF